MGECLPSENHPLPPFNPNRKTVTWERLEAMRLQKLGLSNRYSRHFNVLRTSEQTPTKPFSEPDSPRSAAVVMPPPTPTALRVEKATFNSASNSLAPFSTVGKATCGYFFSRVTDNRKRKFGIPASDLVKWRCSSGSQNR